MTNVVLGGLPPPSVMKEMVQLGVRGVFTMSGFHLVQVKGSQAHPKDAPILAVAPHSSFFDALPVVVMGAPSVVAKGDLALLPLLGSTGAHTYTHTDINIHTFLQCMVLKCVYSIHIHAPPPPKVYPHFLR